ncbi:MAG: ATP phosphoribosyltransferase regulatory subunit [Planctomycetota bacterium]|jgi:histidyl-tRNA synthetase
MKIPPVKGTRDFYPQDMARRNWIIDGWKKISVRNGFEEYDGPIFEYLKMFQIKSGDEIVEQLFSFKDRGERDLALRPEITPTLARMVNQQINSLPKPIKWFSVPRLFRAERPQKGRLREFFQWNIDIIGVDDVLADAEVIFTTIDYLRSVGLKHKDVRVKISSRKLLASSLMNIGIPETQLGPLYSLLDKYSKIPGDTFEKMLLDQVTDKRMVKKIMDFMGTTTLSEVSDIITTNAEVEDAIQELARCLLYGCSI